MDESAGPSSWCCDSNEQKPILRGYRPLAPLMFRGECRWGKKKKKEVAQEIGRGIVCTLPTAVLWTRTQVCARKSTWERCHLLFLLYVCQLDCRLVQGQLNTSSNSTNQDGGNSVITCVSLQQRPTETFIEVGVFDFSELCSNDSAGREELLLFSSKWTRTANIAVMLTPLSWFESYTNEGGRASTCFHIHVL